LATATLTFAFGAAFLTDLRDRITFERDANAWPLLASSRPFLPRRRQRHSPERSW
jgi:hypothetical protein